MTLDELMDDWKDNKEIMKDIFKVLATNGGQIFPVYGNKFAMYDPAVKMNNNIYYFTPDGLYGFSYKLGKVAKINISVPNNWKQVVMKYFFYKRD